MTFEKWMEQVDEYLFRMCGMGSADLPDQNYRLWYDDGLESEEAAQNTLEEEGYE